MPAHPPYGDDGLTVVNDTLRVSHHILEVDTGRNPAAAFEALKRMVQEHWQTTRAQTEEEEQETERRRRQEEITRFKEQQRKVLAEKEELARETDAATNRRKRRRRENNRNKVLDQRWRRENRHVGRNGYRTQIRVGGNETCCW